MSVIQFPPNNILPLDPTEKFPRGKQLYFCYMIIRGVDQVRAQLEWDNWEEGFMTQAEWDRTARLMLKCNGVNV